MAIEPPAATARPAGVPVPPEPKRTPGLPLAPREPFSLRRMFGWSLRVARPAPGRLALSAGLALMVILLGQFSVQLLADVISALQRPAGARGTLPWLVAAFALLALGLAVLAPLSRIASAWSDMEMLRRLRLTLHERLLGLDASYHDRHPLGETSAIVMQYASGSQPILRNLIEFPLVRSIGFVSALGFLIHNLGTAGRAPPALQAALAVLVVALAVASWRLGRGMRGAFDDALGAQTALNTEFNNSAAMPLEVRLLGAEPARARAFAAAAARVATTRLRATIHLEAAREVQRSLPTLLQAAFLVYAALLLASGPAHSVGAILAIYYFVPAAIQPVQELIGFFTGLSASWPLVAEVGALLDAPTEAERAPAGPTAEPAAAAPPAIRLDGVRFRYPGRETPVLDGISHVFPAGHISAIVGLSGSGKSSCLALINGLRRPESGQVEIGDIPLARLDPAWRRRRIATVSQFPLIIDATVRENLLLGAAEATEEEIIALARRTGLWDALLRNQPDRPLEQTITMAPGGGLSGGERRRLAITRALLGRPAVLLLDEPSTGIDELGLAELPTILHEIAASGTTILLVDHNPGLVAAAADEVCCLEAGRFTDIGPPGELAARETLFARLAAIRPERMEGLSVTSVSRPDLPAPCLSPSALSSIPT